MSFQIRMVHVVVLALATFVSSTAVADMMRPMPQMACT